MNRREFQVSALTAASALILGQNAIAAERAAAPATVVDARKLKAVVNATEECIAASKACIAHCIEMYKSGDTSMADCHASVLSMLPLCEAMNTVANNNTAPADLVKKLAAVCADFCRSCANECKPHAKHSKVCSDCMKACEDCAKACDSLANA